MVQHIRTLVNREIMAAWTSNAPLAALLCAAGVLNLPAVAALTLLVLAEKLAPGGPALACIAGLGLVGWSTLLLFP